MKIDVSIIIPCRNEVNFIEQNIRSCFNQQFSGSVEVLIVDGMSDDGTRNVVQNLQSEFSELRLIDNPQRTTPFALNIGIKESFGNYFVILGGHAELDSNFIAKNLENFNSEEIGCTGGIIENVYLNKTGKIIGKAMSSKFGVGNATFRTGGEKSFVDTVAFGMYKKSIVTEIGYFDQALVRNQDDEFNYRVSRKYKIVFDPEIISKYFVRGSFSKLFKQYFQYGYWKVFVNQKHKAITSWRQLFPAFLVFGLAIGFPIAGLFEEFGILYSLGINLYLGMGMYFAGKKCSSFVEFWQILFCFWILHISYGTGYIKGFFDFLILRKKPSDKSKELSR